MNLREEQYVMDNVSGITETQDDAVPMIAWIMPVYNGEKYIQQAIDSILLQPCKDCEVWVVDDGSTDRTAQIVKSIHDARVHYLYQENAGVSAARNNGIRSSRSKYVAFLDADDVICKDAYDEEIHGILKTEQYDLLSFSYFNGDQKLKRGISHKVPPGEIRCDINAVDCFKHISSFVSRRKTIGEENAVWFPKGIKIREDIVFHFLVLHIAHCILSIDRCWSVYRNNIISALHKVTSYAYLANDAIPAWSWCKNRCESQAARDECDARLFAEVSAYILSSCMDGVPVETIRAALTAAPIQEALQNYDALWQSSKNVYEAFMADPEGYRKSLRMKGWFYSLAQRTARLPGIRQLYMRVKYKEDIRAYVL